MDCGNFRQLVLHVGEHIDANDWSEKYYFTNSNSGNPCKWHFCWNKHAFNTQARLVEHVRVHTLEKPFIVILSSY